jgi:hypothetical protein
MAGKKESNIEEEIKNIIKESLKKRLEGWENIDPTLANFTLIDRWLTEIMALGYNDFNVEAAAKDIFELQRPMMGVLVPEKFLEDYRARVFLCNNRFMDEISAFKKYVELRGNESDKVILYAVKQELEFVESGSFILS